MKLKKRLCLLSIISLFCLSGCNWKFWEKWTKGDNTEQKDGSSDQDSTAEEKFTVTFDSRGGSKVAPITVKKGQTITKPNDPTKEDYSFKGWYTGQSLETLFDFSTPIVKDWILFAGWKDKEFTVTFDSQGGSEVDPITVKKGGTITKPTNPTKEGDIFDGWYTEATTENLFDFATPIMSDLILYAGWRHDVFVITFDSQGGSAVASARVEKGQTVARPDDPTKKYCTFTGWYTEVALEHLFNFSTPIVQDWTLYAGWQENPRDINLKIAVFADIQLSAKENVYDSASGTYVAYANAGNTVHAYVSLKNHFELCKEQNVDVILMNGDIVNNAVTHYYDLYEEALQSAYGTNEEEYPEIIFNMGNHEWWDLQEKETENAVSLFKQHARINNVTKETSVKYYLDGTTTLPTYYKVIKGVPFLVVSAENSAGEIKDTMKGEISSWLNEMSQLESVQDGGPIYVLYHYPLHTSLTHGNNALWCAETLEDLLKDYPQAIVFTGDTHYSGVNERAINQVDFTTINIGSSSYSRMDKMSATMTPDEHFYNMKIKGGKTSDELMGDVNYKHEYTPTIHIMNNYDNLDTTIDRYFSTDDKENPIHINQTWNIPRGTNKSNFTFTNARFKNTDSAQALYGADGVSWSNSAHVKFGVKNGKMTVIVPNTIEYHYTEHFKIDVTGSSTTKTYDVVGNYYRYDLEPEDMYFFLEDLPAGENYSIKVTAYDYFDNPSLNYLTSDINDLTCCADEVDNTFTGAYTESSNHLYFDDHVENSNSSIEYYYNGVKRNEYGAPLGQLIRDKVPGKTDGGVNISQYLSIGNQDHCEVILKAKIKNLSNSPLVFGYTLYVTDYSYKNATTANTGQVVPANSDWTSLEWNITKQFSEVVGRESVTFLALVVSADGYGYDPDGYEMHFLLDDMDVAAGAYADIPEAASRYNLEMCTYSPGQWRGEGSAAEVSFIDVYGSNSTSSRKITFANSNNLPATNTANSAATVNASFDLAQTAGIGSANTINAKYCMLSFDVKLSDEFYVSGNNYRNKFYLKIEDNTWKNKVSTLNLVDNLSDFTIVNTDNGWIHVEYNLFDVSEFETLGEGTYAITFGFYGISNETRSSAYVILDNISLTDLPPGDVGEKETASRNNIEMCDFEGGAWRGTGSKAKICFDDVYGSGSTSARRITFANSENLVDVMTATDTHTVNASFNLATTSSIGHPNDIDAKNCTLSFDIKLSQEFFDSENSYKHQFTLKIEDETWHSESVWIPMVSSAAAMTYANTDNGWLHVSYDLSQKPTLVNNLGDETWVITFGFFGITNTTRATASIVLDNIALTANS